MAKTSTPPPEYEKFCVRCGETPRQGVVSTDINQECYCPNYFVPDWAFKTRDGKVVKEIPLAPLEQKKVDYDFGTFSGPLWQRIGKMLDKCGYSGVELNMNDTFGYACAWSVTCDEYDLPTVTELFEKYGHDGVVAWCAVKEGVVDVRDETKKKPLEPIKKEYYPKFDEVVKMLMADINKYYWLPRFRAEKEAKKNGTTV